ncbi:MAG: hypothetical protein HYW78_02875, partial [Parcubacteria group bacterium]|nr:hypothetical protein [Parcubacteria group bacterium]
VENGNNDFKIIPTFHDFKVPVFEAKDFAIKKDDFTKCQLAILKALKASGAGAETILFRINNESRVQTTLEKIDKNLEKLKKDRVVTYDKNSKRYSINETLLKKAILSFDELHQNSTKITFEVDSCEHIGALKSLYFTILEEKPKLAEDADAIVINGDIKQGISHNYEYNGELLPMLNGPDKHEILSALMQKKIIMDVFKVRWRKNVSDKKLSTEQLLKKCLISFFYNVGNHDEPRFEHSKDSIPLYDFDRTLRSELVPAVYMFLQEQQRMDMPFAEVAKIINEKIIRIGESRTFTLNGITIGVKHPHQGGAESRSKKIQDTGNFFQKALIDWPEKELQTIPVVLVANFHTQAFVHMSSFGKTVLGVMTGAMVKDTEFENNMNKVVEHGMVKVTIEFDPKGRILSDTVEVCDHISDKDKKIVFADKLTLEKIAELQMELAKMFDIPWR